MRRHYATRATAPTPQNQPVPGRNDMHQNHAKGYAFKLDDWKRMERFLILGSEGGTYYVDERKLTIENAEAVKRCIDQDGRRVVDMVVDISDKGRAPSNNQALFVLAMCAGLGAASVKSYALDALPKVARIGTHLFNFVQYVEGFRGWGRGLKHAVAKWYDDKPLEKLMFQLVKYQSRITEEGVSSSRWSHRDILRLAHPNPKGQDDRSLIYRWVTRRHKDEIFIPGSLDYLRGFEAMERASSVDEVVQLLIRYKFPMETIPTQFKQDRKVWEILLPNLGMTALVRNLGNLSKCGLLLNGNWDTVKYVINQLTNQDRIRKERIHPIQLLAAMVTYGQGHGARGNSTWEVCNDVLDALDQAFHLSFGNIIPSGKRIMLSIDVSGSMDWPENSLRKIPGMTARVGAGAMVMITFRSEQSVIINAFSDSLVQLNVRKSDTLDRVCSIMRNTRMGGTDCSLPMTHALARKMDIDVFQVYTDNETWAGRIHPFQALDKYRQSTGIPAKLVVVGMTSTSTTIADPGDHGSLDVVGFDTATPQIIHNFVCND